jgi:hypothetical protein
VSDERERFSAKVDGPTWIRETARRNGEAAAAGTREENASDRD